MSPLPQSLRDEEQTRSFPLPIEIEVYVNPDGSVTFADLEAGVIPLVRRLNPDQPLACDARLSSTAQIQEDKTDE